MKKSLIRSCAKIKAWEKSSHKNYVVLYPNEKILFFNISNLLFLRTLNENRRHPQITLAITTFFLIIDLLLTLSNVHFMKYQKARLKYNHNFITFLCNYITLKIKNHKNSLTSLTLWQVETQHLRFRVI